MPRPSPRGFTSRDCDAFEKVQITLDFERLAAADTNKHGTFTTKLTIPPGSVGSHTIRATGVRSHTQSSFVFQITGRRPEG